MAKAFEEYISEHFEKKAVIQQPLSSMQNANTKLCEKRNELAAIEEVFQAKKEQYAANMEELDQRKKVLNEKQKELVEVQKQFEQFMKENDVKRARALKKAADERKAQKQKMKEEINAKQQLADLLVARDRLRIKLDTYRVYKEFMNGAKNESGEFHNIESIINRYETLVRTNKELLEKDESNKQKIEDSKSKLAMICEEKKAELLRCNTKLSGLQIKFEDAQDRAQKWESIWTKIQNTAAKKTLMLGQINMATHNLYQTMYGNQSNSEEPPEFVEDTRLRLGQIQEYIMNLQTILHENKQSNVGLSVKVQQGRSKESHS